MKYLVLISLCILSSCTHQKSADTVALIPVLDIGEKDYPTRKIDIHDIADVEYIPLETTENSLIGVSRAFISDKYIVTSEGFSGRNVYFFDYTGKLLWKFDKKGSGPGEFSYLNLVVVDFDMEECYIYDINKREILIYSFIGEYKNSILLKEVGEGLAGYTAFTTMLNYDADFILGYDSAPVLFLHKLTDIRSPYYLISKKDGSYHSLDLEIRNGLSNQIYNGKNERIGYLYHFPLLQNGSECWISELSSDTIYSLIDRKLVPIAIQTPSIHSCTPPLTIFPNGFTDYFLVFNVVSLFADEKNPQRPYNESETLVWNRCLNKIESWEIHNSDILSSTHSIHIPVTNINYSTIKNCGFFSYGPEGLIKHYKKGELKGRLKEIAANLREDDNNVIALVKYKEGIDWNNLVE